MQDDTIAPLKLTHTHPFGDTTIVATGERWKGDDDYKDTEIRINTIPLCWITWSDKEAFIKELNAVIEKYRI